MQAARAKLEDHYASTATLEPGNRILPYQHVAHRHKRRRASWWLEIVATRGHRS